MRSFHALARHHPKKLTLTISAVLSLVLILLIILAGFTVLDAQVFFFGFFQSAVRVTASYFISLVLAIALVLIATASKKLEDFLVPVFDVLQSFPSFALFPLLLVWFGKSSLVTIVILVVSMVCPMIFTLLTGKKEINEELLEAAEIYEAKGISYYTSVFFPLLFPAIITGSIIAWGEAWETIIAAEIIVNVPGVGTYLADTATQSPKLLAVGIIALLMILFLINKYIWLKFLALSTQYANA